MKIIIMGTPKYTKHTTVFLALVIIQVNESTKKSVKLPTCGKCQYFRQVLQSNLLHFYTMICDYKLSTRRLTFMI